MNDSIFKIGASGINAAGIVEKIRASVAEKMQMGYYTDACVARAERTNMESIKDEDSFLTFYLECLRDTVFIDIGDFEIFERRIRFSRLFISLKRIIWKLLKFYTYRLWSQQNQVNGGLLAAIECVVAGHRDKIDNLESRIAKLEAHGKSESSKKSANVTNAGPND